MADGNSNFKGLYPYASELFGVYKPLLGWRGRSAERRVAQAMMRNMTNEELRRARAGEAAEEDPRAAAAADRVATGGGSGAPSRSLSPAAIVALAREMGAGARPSKSELYAALDTLKASVLTSSVEPVASASLSPARAEASAERALVFSAPEDLEPKTVCAVRFSGGLTIPGSASTTVNGACTVEFWVRFKEGEPCPGANLFWLRGADGQSAIRVFLGSVPGQLYIYNNASASLWSSQTKGMSYTPGQWTHFALTRTLDRLAFYKDGALVYQTDPKVPPVALVAGDGDLAWAAPYKSVMFTGDLAELRLWSVARSGSEIQQHYNSCLKGREAAHLKGGLVGYWPLDALEQAPLNLAAPSARPGTMVGGEVLSDGPTLLGIAAPIVPMASTFVAGAPARSAKGSGPRPSTSLIEELIEEDPGLLSRMAGGVRSGYLGVRLLDPLANLDVNTQQAMLTPVGIIQLYRQIFYELDTFLGPPVSHVWVSPGGSVELYETHSKRTVVEREDSVSFETTSRSEREVQIEDELSSTIKSDDENNMSVGASASLSGGIPGIVQASASANLSLGQSHRQSREEAHRQKRTQSERLSNEIRRSFKTTFRTTVETHDTSSRRYLLANTTSKLVNYELRRKMRRVGVVLQHVGTQLAWQVYLDKPGQMLKIGKLIHATKPEDRPEEAPPPERSAPMPQERRTFTVKFPFTAGRGLGSLDDGTDEDYLVWPKDPKEGYDPNESGLDVEPPVASIVFQKTFPAPKPPPNYVLQSVRVVDVSSDGSAAAAPRVDYLPPELEIKNGAPTGSFIIQLKEANFNDNLNILFSVEAVYEPDPVVVSANLAKQAEEDGKVARERKAKKLADEKAAAIDAIRERLKREGEVRQRPSEDLREEERILVYRMLLGRLHLPTMSADQHLMSELIRTIFDIDKLLYFVAQDWWAPRPLDAPTYHVSEEAAPARMGTSLGWKLQVDGDARRNAFVNSPWVKAVLPVRPGMEVAALNWLRSDGVELDAGLDEKYLGAEPELQGMKVGEVLMKLAENLSALEPPLGPATETVYERGFDPLKGGFRANEEQFAAFDQWVEILPTDQVVAVEYNPPTG